MPDNEFFPYLGEFGAEELYQIAFLLEDEGLRFYDGVASSADDLRIKNEVGFLRDEEARHKAYFRGRLTQEPAGEEAGRVRGFVRRQFIEPLSEYYRGGRIRRAGEALRFGAVLEQKSIDFYEALKSTPAGVRCGWDLEEIIQEEKKHRKKIYEILSI